MKGERPLFPPEQLVSEETRRRWRARVCIILDAIEGGAVLSGQEEREDYTEPLTDGDREKYRRTCWQYGLYMLPKTREVAVAVRRQAVARILGSTLAYSMTMARHPLCTDKARRVTQDGPTKVCLAFSSGILEGDPPI